MYTLHFPTQNGKKEGISKLSDKKLNMKNFLTDESDKKNATENQSLAIF